METRDDELDGRLDVKGVATVTTDFTGGVFAQGGGLHKRRVWRSHINIWRVGGVPKTVQTGGSGERVNNAGHLRDECSISGADGKKRDRFEMCAV